MPSEDLRPGFAIVEVAFTGQVPALVEQFFDVNVTKSQRSANGFNEFTENVEPRFIEENHGIFFPEQEFKAFLCFASVFGER